MPRLGISARRALESSLARVLGARLQPSTVLEALLQALEEAHNAPPTAFHIALHPADYQALLTLQPTAAEALAEIARLVMLHFGWTPELPPRVWLYADASVAPSAVRVQAHSITEAPDATTSKPTTNLPRRPFIITPDGRHIPLAAKRIRVGRAQDNDVILDDLRVSRHHLELRWQEDVQRFLAVDLGSAGGTRLNGEPIQQCTLEPGDVLSLAGVTIIYGEAEGPSATQKVK